MDRDELRVRLQAATSDWIRGSLDASSSAKKGHEYLLSLIGGQEGDGKPGLDASHVATVLANLKTLATGQMRLACHALDALQEAECRFQAFEEDRSGERFLIELRMTDVTYLNDVHTILKLADSVGQLSATQQKRITVFLDEALTVRYLEVYQRLEIADGTSAERVKLALSLGAAQSLVQSAKDSMSPAALAWLTEHQEKLVKLKFSDLKLPIFPSNNSKPEDLFKGCVSLNQISDCLVRPIPLAGSDSTEIYVKWSNLWKTCDEAAECLSMVAAWMRCLASTSEFRRCQICFRHLGVGMKKNCSLHQRSAGVRIPSREQHVGDLYKHLWKMKTEAGGVVQALLNCLSTLSESQSHSTKLASLKVLEPDVATAAASLAQFLTALQPFLSEKLQNVLTLRFEDAISLASREYAKVLRFSTPEFGGGPPLHASRILSYERFFGSFFGMSLPSDLGTDFGLGKAIDLDHPLTSTSQAITVEKLALDLLHLDSWICVDKSFDHHAYLNVDSVRQVIATALDAECSLPTYSVLGSIFHAKPQTVQQALQRKKKVLRRRLLIAGKENLKNCLLDKPPT